MNLTGFKIDAYLLKKAKKIPVLATCGSRHTLLVQFLNGYHFDDGTHFDDIQFHINHADFHLGPCRIATDLRNSRYGARLTFLSDVFNLEALFSQKRLISLRDSFANLQLVLDYKTKIKSLFKDYTANLSYDLNVYRSFFDEVDREYAEEPEDVRTQIQRVVIDTEGRKFMRFLDDKLTELEHIVYEFTREEHESHAYFFRRLLWNVIMCSPFMRRTNLKPRGYAGDYIMMKMIYLNDYEGNSTFSKLMHKHPLEHTAAQAVRNRRKLIIETFKKLQADNASAHDRIRILSVACGPAYELQDILASSSDECEKYHFTLLDQDQSALDEAAKLINQLKKEYKMKINVRYLNESVRTMLKSSYLVEKWGKFDFIYSMGLFDYLTPPVAAGVLKKLYELLEAGGHLLIGNFHVSNPSRCYMEYWHDWVLYYRTEEEFLSLLPEKASGKGEVLFEGTRSQMFLNIEKN
jgi:extracellular factor (EF) 3-hydroxypalmitic acid methyl ester biosynthesis protein